MRRILAKMLRGRRQRGEQDERDGLTRLLRRYCVEQQQIPRELGELVARNYLDRLPEPPPGRQFVIDRDRVEIRLQ